MMFAKLQEVYYGIKLWFFDLPDAMQWTVALLFGGMCFLLGAVLL